MLNVERLIKETQHAGKLTILFDGVSGPGPQVTYSYGRWCWASKLSPIRSQPLLSYYLSTRVLTDGMFCSCLTAADLVRPRYRRHADKILMLQAITNITVGPRESRNVLDVVGPSQPRLMEGIPSRDGVDVGGSLLLYSWLGSHWTLGALPTHGMNLGQVWWPG